MEQKLKIIVYANYILITLLGISTYLLDRFVENDKMEIGILVILLLSTISLKAYEDKLRKKISSSLDVEKIEMLLKYLYTSLNFQANESVSITIHKKIDEKRYERFTHTIKHGTLKDDKGEIFDIKKGIVRQAFERKNGDMFCDTFKDDVEKYQKLINTYHYSQEEAQKMLNDGRKTYLCRTIVQNDNIWGALYMTSSIYRGFHSRNEKVKVHIDTKIKNVIEFIQNEIL